MVGHNTERIQAIEGLMVKVKRFSEHCCNAVFCQPEGTHARFMQGRFILTKPVSFTFDLGKFRVIGIFHLHLSSLSRQSSHHVAWQGTSKARSNKKRSSRRLYVRQMP